MVELIHQTWRAVAIVTKKVVQHPRNRISKQQRRRVTCADNGAMRARNAAPSENNGFCWCLLDPMDYRLVEAIGSTKQRQGHRFVIRQTFSFKRSHKALFHRRDRLLNNTGGINPVIQAALERNVRDERQAPRLNALVYSVSNHCLLYLADS